MGRIMRDIITTAIKALAAIPPTTTPLRKFSTNNSFTLGRIRSGTGSGGIFSNASRILSMSDIETSGDSSNGGKVRTTSYNCK